MAEPGCHPSNDASPDAVVEPERSTPLKALILDDLGVKRVSAWARVAENTVHQWLSRGRIPPAKVPAIVAGAREAGLKAPMRVLWPEMVGPADV